MYILATFIELVINRCHIFQLIVTICQIWFEEILSLWKFQVILRIEKYVRK